MREFRKWAAVVGLHLQDLLGYRSQLLIGMMTELVPVIIMPAVWLASFQGRPTLGGFSPGAITSYYFVTLLLTNVMVSRVMMSVVEDVREGRLSSHLTRPYHYIAFQYAGNVATRLLRTLFCLPLAAAFAVVFHGALRWDGYRLGPEFWAAVVGGHALSFLLSVAMGLLALFLTEMSGPHALYHMALRALSGDLVPLALLPSWLEAPARWLPFRYTLSFPLEILLRRLSPAEVLHGFALLALWLLLASLILTGGWRAGLRRYTGVGM
jgi:ABC-2 type transport system permease protein